MDGAVRRRWLSAAVLAVLLLPLAGCGGSGDDKPSAAEPEPSSSSKTPAATPSFIDAGGQGHPDS